MSEVEVDIRKVVHGSAEYEAEVALRLRVLREPLGLVFEPDQLAAETDDVHLAAFAEGALVGCLVLTRISESTVQMRQVAVEPALQGRGVGSRLVAESERIAGRSGYREMLLHARAEAVPFYIRLGYAVRGEPFEEVTIPHREMTKAL